MTTTQTDALRRRLGEVDEGYDDHDDEGEEEHLLLRQPPSPQQGDEGAGQGPSTVEHGVVMAVARKGNRVGYACFQTEAQTIWVNELLVNTDLRETVQALKLHLRPTLFLIDTHAMADEDFCKLLGSAVSEDRVEFQLRVVKARSWDYRRSINQLCACLEVRELAEASRAAEEEDREDDLMLRSLISTTGGGYGGGGLDARRNYDRLSAVVDFTAEPLLVKALGALLTHLQSSTFQLELGGRVPVRGLRRFDLGSFVRLDSNTLSSLHIFLHEKHPNVISGRGQSKEGFSIFALLDQTRSRPGRKCLKEWMLKPLRSVDRIVQRQLVVELLMQPDAMEVVTNARRLLGKVADVQRCLVRLRRASVTVTDWVKLAQTAQHVLLLHNCLAVLAHLAARHGGGGEGGGPSAVEAVVQGMLGRISREALGRAADAINTIIDVDLTRESKMVVVRTGYDEELDSARADFDALEEFLSAEARTILAAQPSRLLSTLSVQFLPQVGFLVIVKVSEKVAVENDPSFRFVFAQGDSMYWKTPRMDELDDQLGDLSASIQDRQAALLRALGEAVLAEELALVEAVWTCAELDVLISFAQLAGGLNWVRPGLTEDRLIIIKEGRHPLQELTVEAFIPNDVFLLGGGVGGAAEEEGQATRGLAVVTGPNFSGKSVYLKMVGVLTYLAHLGCFLPCQQAMVGLVDGIYTRMASAESVSVQQSTFTIDCSQMNTIFRGATQDSLVLVDEFGKGSAETDGLALLVASMVRLQQLGGRALVTTHLLEIFQRHGLLSPHLAQEICYRMDVFVPPPSSATATDGGPAIQTVVPLFKLTKGVASSSDGMSCAVLAGLAVPLIRRAETIAQCHVEGTLPVQPLAKPLIARLKNGSKVVVKGEDGKEGNEEDEAAEGGEQAGANVLRFNAKAQEALEAFLRVEDWTECEEEELAALGALLQKV